MKALLLFGLIFGLVQPAWAGNGLKVIAVRGVAKSGKDLLKVGQEVSSGQAIETDPSGAVKLESQSHSIFQVGGGARLELLTISEESTTIELLSGLLRAKVAPDIKRKQFVVKTKAAVMGVRGTDFLGIANPVLGEAEIIVFEGKVNFGSTSDSGDQKLIEEGHWGGIGGRFGSKIAPVLALPAAVLGHFDQVSTF